MLNRARGIALVALGVVVAGSVAAVSAAASQSGCAGGGSPTPEQVAALARQYYPAIVTRVEETGSPSPVALGFQLDGSCAVVAHSAMLAEDAVLPGLPTADPRRNDVGSALRTMFPRADLHPLSGTVDVVSRDSLPKRPKGPEPPFALMRPLLSVTWIVVK